MPTKFNYLIGKEGAERMKANESIGDIANRALFETFRAAGRDEPLMFVSGEEAKEGWQELKTDVDAFAKSLKDPRHTPA
jgi:hypothetical protein